MPASEVKHFLIFFDRAQGGIVEIQKFDGDHEREAVAAYTEAERTYKDRIHGESADLEIVLLGAESEATLVETHAHYFTKSSSPNERVERLAKRVNDLAAV